MPTAFSGRCLCGAIHYQCEAEPVIAGHCQCTDCRRSSGTGHCSHIGVPKDAVTITGEAALYESAADSGNLVGRAFCPTCGAAIYSLNSGMPELIFIRASSLDDLEVFKPQMVVYTSRAATWDKIDSSIPTFETMPPPSDTPATDV